MDNCIRAFQHKYGYQKRSAELIKQLALPVWFIRAGAPLGFLLHLGYGNANALLPSLLFINQNPMLFSVISHDIEEVDTTAIPTHSVEANSRADLEAFFAIHDDSDQITLINEIKQPLEYHMTSQRFYDLYFRNRLELAL